MQFLQDFWPFILSVVTGGVWLLRLEGRLNATESGLQRVLTQRHEDLKHADDRRGELLAMMTEIRADIKSLMRTTRQS